MKALKATLLIATLIASTSVISAKKNQQTTKTTTSLTESSSEESDSDVPFRAEVMPKFKGGDFKKFQSYVNANVSYPSKMAQQNITGRVMVSFIINTDGSVEISKVLESPHEDLSEEVIRVILKTSKDWTPAKQDGKLVSLKCTIPVSFMPRATQANNSQSTDSWAEPAKMRF